MSMSQLKLFVPGSPGVEQNGQTIDVKPRKALALFIYLAWTEQAQERDSLARFTEGLETEELRGVRSALRATA